MKLASTFCLVVLWLTSTLTAQDTLATLEADGGVLKKPTPGMPANRGGWM